MQSGKPKKEKKERRKSGEGEEEEEQEADSSDDEQLMLGVDASLLEREAARAEREARKARKKSKRAKQSRAERGERKPGGGGGSGGGGCGGGGVGGSAVKRNAEQLKKEERERQKALQQAHDREMRLKFQAKQRHRLVRETLACFSFLFLPGKRLQWPIAKSKTPPVANSKEQKIETLTPFTAVGAEESPRLTRVASISLLGNKVLVEIGLTPVARANEIHVWRVCGGGIQIAEDGAAGGGAARADGGEGGGGGGGGGEQQ